MTHSTTTAPAISEIKQALADAAYFMEITDTYELMRAQLLDRYPEDSVAVQALDSSYLAAVEGVTLA